MKRRGFLGAAATGLLSGLLQSVAFQNGVFAQVNPAQNGSAKAQIKFSYTDVVKRAKDLSLREYSTKQPVLPEPLADLDFDSYRDIKFREDKTFFNNSPGAFRMQLFPLGFLFKRPVTINILRDGLAAPIPYTSSLFDYGKAKFDKVLPVDTGFAGFRLYYPLSDSKSSDEMISFIGASYFRFISRGQKYGLSARGLALNAGIDGQPEEFPHFTEFWVQNPVFGSEGITIYALMDSASLSGAYQFNFSAGAKSSVEVTATLFARKDIVRPGIAPLTSMFFYGENNRRHHGDYRHELHDSDGLLIHNGTGEMIWRPLLNPTKAKISIFQAKDIKGFGLMQRDVNFDHYQDLDLEYEKRPTYWVEPLDEWGEGQIELAEMPTTDETNDNIAAYWMPKAKMEAGQSYSFRYRISSLVDASTINPVGYAVNTFQAPAHALGANEKSSAGTTRFLIDFAGGELGFHQAFPDVVQVVATAANGKLLRSFMTINREIKGFRVGVDVSAVVGETTDIRVFLKAGTKTLTETWTMPWKSE